MLYDIIRISFCRARQLQHIKKFNHPHLAAWCGFFDELVEYMQWPQDQYTPGLHKRDALQNLFQVDLETYFGTATFSVPCDTGQSTVTIRFGIQHAVNGQNVTAWEVMDARQKLLGTYWPDNPEQNKNLLQNAAGSVFNAFIEHAKTASS
jgi:hypothetical protein